MPFPSPPEWLRRFPRRCVPRLQVGDFSIQVMGVGKIFILLTLGLGFASLNTGNNLLYLVFAMNLSLILVSGVMSHSALSRLRLRRRLPEAVFAAEPFPLEISVANEKRRLPTFSLSLRDDPQLQLAGGGESQNLFLLQIPAAQSRRLIYSAVAPRRGRLQLRQIETMTLYPFGIIRKTRRRQVGDELLVYPRRRSPGADFLQRVCWRGEFLSGRIGAGANPYGIRDYCQGDPTRYLHWRSSAKRGRLMVKEFESEKRQRFLVDLVLIRPQPPRGEEEVEALLSAACGLIDDLYHRGFELLFRLNGRDVESIDGRYLSHYLQTLALLDLAGLPPTLPPIPPPAGEGTRLFVGNVPPPWPCEGVIDPARLGETDVAGR